MLLVLKSTFLPIVLSVSRNVKDEFGRPKMRKGERFYIIKGMSIKISPTFLNHNVISRSH